MGGQGGGSSSHSPQANQPSSRDFTHKRQILHKSLNNGAPGVQQQPVVKGAGGGGGGGGGTSSSIDGGPKELIN